MVRQSPLLQLLRHLLGLCQIQLKRVQIAIVHADHLRSGINRNVQFDQGVDFHQRFHSDGARKVDQLFQHIGGGGRYHEEDGVGTGSSGLGYLIRGGDEILAQYGSASFVVFFGGSSGVHPGTCQIGETSLEPPLFREYADDAGTGSVIHACLISGIYMRGDITLGGGGTFELRGESHGRTFGLDDLLQWQDWSVGGMELLCLFQ
mmetsp:Transcript_21037/g.37748  ORF Transcript_21037/g.37748 Transcript_21037/m.37748 type:complete len:205 (-) Transcript_21037:356-970(-)